MIYRDSFTPTRCVNTLVTLLSGYVEHHPSVPWCASISKWDIPMGYTADALGYGELLLILDTFNGTNTVLSRSTTSAYITVFTILCWRLTINGYLDFLRRVRLSVYELASCRRRNSHLPFLLKASGQVMSVTKWITTLKTLQFCKHSYSGWTHRCGTNPECSQLLLIVFIIAAFTLAWIVGPGTLVLYLSSVISGFQWFILPMLINTTVYNRAAIQIQQ